MPISILIAGVRNGISGMPEFDDLGSPVDEGHHYYKGNDSQNDIRHRLPDTTVIKPIWPRQPDKYRQTN